MTIRRNQELLNLAVPPDTKRIVEVGAMECENVRPKMLELIEGELEQDERASVEEHLRGCPVCKAEVTALESALSAIKHSVPLIAPSGPYLTPARRICLMEAYAKARRKRGLFTLRRLVAAAAVLAILVSGWSLYDRYVASRLSPSASRNLTQGPALPSQGRVPFVVVSLEKGTGVDLRDGHLRPYPLPLPFDASYVPGAPNYRKLVPVHSKDILIPAENAYYDPREPVYWW